MNSFGTYLRLTTFGESHGRAMGGVLDGLPAGLEIDMNEVENWMALRRSGGSTAGTTGRREKDIVRILSGLYEGRTLGTPIGFIIENEDVRSEDYKALEGLYRPGHADYTTEARYGLRDPRGGGRASARETVSRVVGGALAMEFLKREGVRVDAYASSIGDVDCERDHRDLDLSLEAISQSAVRCPDMTTSEKMVEAINRAREDKDTLGGVVTCIIKGLRPGVGNPTFGKLQARLAEAMMSIPAAKGFEYGMGFGGARKRGSEVIDTFTTEDGRITTLTNYSGGIQGGISNGQDIVMRIAFKPISTMPGREIRTITREGVETTFTAHGRHDVTAVPRAVAVVASMGALSVADALLSNNTKFCR